MHCNRSPILILALLTGVLIAGNCQATVTLPETQGGVSVQVNTNGDYEILSRDPAWTFSGNVSYPIQEIKTLSGQDTIGAYQEVTFRWNAQFSGGIRRYDDKPAVLFSVNVPAGVNVT